MEKAKFWIVQIVMVAFVSLVFGSPVMAHRDGGHKWSKWSSKSDYKAHKAEKRDNWFHKKLIRNVKKYDRKARNLKKKMNKIAAKGNKHSKRWMKWMERKHTRYVNKRDWYQAKYDNHMAEKHAVAEEEPKPEPKLVECDEGYELQGDPAQCVLIEAAEDPCPDPLYELDPTGTVCEMSCSVNLGGTPRDPNASTSEGFPFYCEGF